MFVRQIYSISIHIEKFDRNTNWIDNPFIFLEITINNKQTNSIKKTKITYSNKAASSF